MVPKHGQLLFAVIGFLMPMLLMPTPLDLGVCEPKIVECKCGQMPGGVRIPIKQCVHFYRWKPRCRPCQDLNEENLCGRFQFCEECEESSRTCARCPINRYGSLCSADCLCKNEGICDREGRCICRPHFIGRLCEIRQECPQPPALQDGTIVNMPEHLFYGVSVRYSCRGGSQLLGDAIITCLSPGIWSGQPPTCLPLCPTLVDPDYGSVRRGESPIPGNQGLWMEYVCNDGFELGGPQTRWCQKDGTWGGVSATCKPKYTCPEPSIPEYSSILILGKGIADEFGFTKGASIRYSCKPGFVREENPQKSAQIECLDGGRWSAEPHKCIIKSGYCKDPGILQNGVRQVIGGIERTDVGVFEKETTLIFQCNMLYFLVGTTNITCREDSTWSNVLPFCMQLTTCTSPADLPYGSVIFEKPSSASILVARVADHNSSMSSRIGRMPFGPPRMVALKPTIPVEELGSIVNANLDKIGSNVPDIGDETVEKIVRGFFAPGESQTEGNSSVENFGEERIASTGAPRAVRQLTNLESTTSTTSTTQRLFMQPRRPFGISTASPQQKENEERTKSALNARIPDGHYHVGTKATFSCESNYYKLLGSTVRTCASTGKWSGRPPTCIPECGRSSAPRAPMVTHGTPSEVGQWPWQVAIAHSAEPEEENPHWFLWCGGSLIAEHWVMSAAHCVTYSSTNIAMPKQDFQLYFGKHFRKDSEDDPEVQIRQVDDIFVHHDYAPTTFDSDISLLRVWPAVTLSPRIQVVCLPDPDLSEEHLKQGSIGTVSGWGMTENGGYASDLQHVQVPVVTRRQCEEDYRNKSNLSITVSKNMFCAGLEEGKFDSCSGDSGGPMVFPEERPDGRRWIQQGIVSWGSPLGCGLASQHGGYVRVEKFISWIHQFL